MAKTYNLLTEKASGSHLKNVVSRMKKYNYTLADPFMTDKTKKYTS